MSAAPPETPRVESPSRAARVLPWALLAGVLALHAGVMLVWIARDHSFAHPLQAGAAQATADALHTVAAGGLGAWAGQPLPGWYSLPVLGLRALLGPDLRLLAWSQLLLMLGAQCFVFDAGRRLGGTAAGLVAAAVLPMIPEVALYEHCWDPHMAEVFLLAGAVASLVCSRSLSRPLPTLAFAVFAGLNMQASAMSTDNYCALAAVGALGLGAAARGLVLGRGPLGEPVRRWRTAVAGLLIAGACAWVLLRGGSLWPDLAYIRREDGARIYADLAPRWSAGALSAYARFWALTSLGPLLSLALLIAAPAFLRRPGGRAELGAWLLLPLVAFSLLAKKNAYYVGLSLPAAALVIGVGLTRIRWRRLGGLLAITVVLLVGLQWIGRSFPTLPVPRALTAVMLPPDTARVMQTRLVPEIAPEESFAHARATALLRAHVRGSACDPFIPRRVWVLDTGDYQDMRLGAALVDSCVGDVAGWEQTEQQRGFRWILVADPDCRPGSTASDAVRGVPWAALASWVAGQKALRRIGEDRSEQPCLSLYQVSGWFPPLPQGPGRPPAAP